MQIESACGDSVELLKSPPGITPEALNAVDMVRASGELVCSMLDSKVLRVADINQTVVAAPAITVDDRLGCDPTATNGLYSSFPTVGHNLCIDLAVALQEAKDDGLATVLPLAPRPRLPRARRASKYDSSTSTSPLLNGDRSAQSSAMRRRILRKIMLTVYVSGQSTRPRLRLINRVQSSERGDEICTPKFSNAHNSDYVCALQ